MTTHLGKRPLAEHLVSDMRTHFLNMEENKLLALSTLLDPRFKKVAFTHKDAADKGIRTIVAEGSTT